MNAPTPFTREALDAEARRLGFVACGVADLAPSARADALDAWLRRGHAGVMRYLHRRAKQRKAPATIVPGAVRAVVVLENYFTPDGPDDGTAPKVARYARGMDYHVVVLARLRELAEWMLANGAVLAHAWCDDGPVPERELAERAGLGWIGRNTMLIRPGLGSWTFIGTIFTDVPLPVSEPLRTDHCGTCTRCLDACPTQAFVADRVLDATKCLSYLTIEQDGPLPSDVHGWAFGCDICNEVCPWNEKFAVPSTVELLAPRPDTAHVLRDELDDMDEAAFAARFADTPLARPGLAGMRRNVAAALGGTPASSRPASDAAPPPA
jgi:epoxyqueuosine reductase